VPVIPSTAELPSVGAASSDPSLFTATPSRSPLATRRRRSRNAVAETIKIVLGGAVGLAIGAAVLWYGMGVDPLRRNSKPREENTTRSVDPRGNRPSGRSSTVASKVDPTASDDRRPRTSSGTSNLVKAVGKDRTKADADSNLAKVSLEYRRAQDDAPPGQMSAELRLVNHGATPVQLEKLTLRYWYKGDSQPRFWCDSTSIGAGRVTYRFIKLDQPVSSADGICEVGFLAAADQPDVGIQGMELKIRLTSADELPRESSQDYSALATSTSFVKTDRITIYYDGKLIHGTEPPDLAGRQIVVSGAAPAEVARPFPGASRATRSQARETRQRVAVPAQELLEQAAADVERVFRTTDKRSRGERVELVKRMQRTARETDDRPAEQFTLFKRGAEIAQTCGEANLVVELVGQLAERFEIDAALMRQKLLLKTMDVVNDEAHLQQAVVASRETIFDLILDDHYEEALKLADRCVDLCREPIGKSQRKFVTDGRNSLRALNLQWQDFVKARQSLAQTPEDPAANSVVGRWLCLQIDDWDVGLRHLANSADQALSEVATADLATNRTLEAQQKLADQWYELSQTSPTYTGYAARSLYWYEQTAGRVSGLDRAKTEQRIKALREQLAEYDKTTFGHRALRSLRSKDEHSLQNPGAGR